MELCPKDNDPYCFDRFGQQKTKRKISDIYMWSKAFDAFMCVWRVWLSSPVNKPFHANIVTYANSIRQMQKDGLDFLLYDRVYRQYRAAEQHKLDWSITRQTIYNRVVLSKAVKSQNKFNNQSSQSFRGNKQSNSIDNANTNSTKYREQSAGFIPRGYCYSYHNQGQFCPNEKDCSYRHECPHCGRGVHPANSCKFRSG